ncbi:MAG: hypothetical protein HUU34_00760 [Saprospiraceae bacterium]|jgi:hypothetical protein|nr:hypothetical protein [Saprospiraceae bacterium]
MKELFNCAMTYLRTQLPMSVHKHFFAKAIPTMFVLMSFTMSVYGQTPQQDPAVAKLQRELERRNKISATRYVDDPDVRSVMNASNEAAFLAENVIAEKAKKLGIPEPTELEMHSMLMPMLIQQGLIDADCANIFNDPNIATWIKGQEGMTWADFRRSAKTLVLWTKIAIQSVDITEDSVRAYVERNPGMAIIPAKVRIVLTQYVAPQGLASRSVMPHEVLAPTLALTTRAAIAELEKPAPAAYEHLRLWLELDKIDPMLRAAISGQQVGFKFSPIALNNGAIVEGYIEGFSPEIDLTNNPGFWAMAAIRARLAVTNQSAEFEKLVGEFLADEMKSPAVRGFWGKLWGGVKRSFSYISGFAGGALAFVATGSPQAAFIGAKIGYQIGNAVKGWFSSRQIAGPQFPSGGIQIPQGYLSGNRFSVPAAYQTTRYPQANMTIPPMTYGYSQPAYQPYNPNGYHSPVHDQWAPQMFFPQPIGYY